MLPDKGEIVVGGRVVDNIPEVKTEVADDQEEDDDKNNHFNQSPLILKTSEESAVILYWLCHVELIVPWRRLFAINRLIDCKA